METPAARASCCGDDRFNPCRFPESTTQLLTIGEAPRRGRIYTTAPETFTDALAEAPPDRLGPGEPISVENYGRVADALRRERTVAQVLCLEV